MELFKDLTYYSYDHFENAYNVGWIDWENEKNEPYDCDEIISRLLGFRKYRVNMIRGGYTVQWEHGGEKYTLGYSEFRVIAADGKVYASPDTILFSISEMGYRPPEVFIDALFNGISPDSDEYGKYIEKYDPQGCWGASQEEKAKIEKMETVIRNKDISAFKELIAEDRSYLDIVTNDGSVLNCAIKNGAEDIALLSIDMGISLTNFDGFELLTALENKNSTVADKLIRMGVPMRNDSMRYNPLFMAIAYKMNDIAVRILVDHPELDKVYSNEFVRDCGLLQWCAMRDNIEMFSIIKNGLG